MCITITSILPPPNPNVLATFKLHICWNFVGNCNTEGLAISRSGNTGGWHGVMFTDLFLDIILHLLVEISVIQESSFSISIFILYISIPRYCPFLKISEYEKFEVGTEGEVSLLKFTRCPFLASISSRGRDLNCPNSIRIFSLVTLDSW